MEEEFIYDISKFDLSKRISIQKPNDYDYCVDLKNSTPARLCVGKVGTRCKTETYLRLRADHAVAIDAVWSEVDEGILDELGFFKIKTLVQNKEEYITRPDLGGKLSYDTIQCVKENCINNPDIQILVSDGLSSTAINNNIADIYSITKDILKGDNVIVGTPIFIKYGTVQAADEIIENLNPKITVFFIGERPGLTTGESMSAYIFATNSETQKACISNIHRNGIPPVEAGAQVVHIIETMQKESENA